MTLERHGHEQWLSRAGWHEPWNTTTLLILASLPPVGNVRIFRMQSSCFTGWTTIFYQFCFVYLFCFQRHFDPSGDPIALKSVPLRPWTSSHVTDQRYENGGGKPDCLSERIQDKPGSSTNEKRTRWRQLVIIRTNTPVARGSCFKNKTVQFFSK